MSLSAEIMAEQEDKLESFFQKVLRGDSGNLLEYIEDTRRKLIIGSIISSRPSLLKEDNKLMEAIQEALSRENLKQEPELPPKNKTEKAANIQEKSDISQRDEEEKTPQSLVLTLKRSGSGTTILGHNFLFLPLTFIHQLEKISDFGDDEIRMNLYKQTAQFSLHLLENHYRSGNAAHGPGFKIRYGLLLFRVFGYGKYRIMATRPEWKIEIKGASLPEKFQQVFIKGFLAGISLYSKGLTMDNLHGINIASEEGSDIFTMSGT